MDKRKKYILVILPFLVGMIIILSRAVLWDNYIQSLINKRIESSGWNISSGIFSGNFLTTFKIKQIELNNKNGSSVKIDKVVVNIGFLSSLFNVIALDLFTAEGMDCKYLYQNNSNLQFDQEKLMGEIPFKIKSFFIDARIETKISDEDYALIILAGGQFNGTKSPMLDFDLLKVSLDDNINLACKFNSLSLGYNQNYYFLKDLEGEMFGLPVNEGNVSINKIDSTLKGIIEVPQFSFPDELFSKLPLKTKFSTFTGKFEFESDFQYFDGQLSIENEIGLDMQGNFKFGKKDNLWILNSLELIGDNSNLLINGAWEEEKRLSCYMNLKNLDLSGWIKNQKPTQMSGLFILDGGLNNNGALDLIDITLELVETKYFDQGEISINGQMTYNDSVLSTIDPVMLFIGDNYITIDGSTDFIKHTLDIYTDMEKADIDLINGFIPGEFLSGKATGNLKIFGDISSPSASAELVCEKVNINNFNLESLRLNSHLSVIDSIPSGFVDIKAGKGTYKNRSFDSGTVSAIIDNKLIKIENCHFQSGKDFLQLSGSYDGYDNYEIDRLQLAYKENYLINSGPVSLFFKDSILNVQPFEFHINDGTMEGLITGGINPEGRFKMSNFEAEILTQFLDDNRLKFSGLIFGEIWISMNENDFDIDTDLSLKKGKYMQEQFDELMLSCLYKDGVLHIDDLSMTRKGLMGLQVSGIIPIMKSHINKPLISMHSNFSNLSLEFIHRFIPNFYNLSGQSTGSINIGGKLDSTSFQYDLNVQNAKFDVIDLGYFKSKGSYSGNMLKVKEVRSERYDGFIVGFGDIPFDFNLGSKSFGKFFKNKEFAFNTHSKISSLPFLSPYITNLDSAVGNFEIELSLNGFENNIQRNGKIIVSNASLHTLLLSNPITSIDGLAIINNNQLTINNLQAMIYNYGVKEKAASKHNTNITGNIDFSQFFNPDYDLLLKAKNASYQLLFLDISGKSNLNLNIAGRDTVFIDGLIEMQEGNIFYEFMTEDVGTPIQNHSENLLEYNLNIPIQGKSYFKNSQIDAEFTGEINLSQVGNQEVNFGGQINVEDGSVFSYKDYFDKLQGIVSFDNKGFNPYIDVSAYTMIDDERIDLSIKGGIEDLDIILESGSGFSESDILELLTWGKRFEDDAWTSTGFGNQTVSILGTLLENQLEKNLKESNIGMMDYVDDINISGAAGLFQGTNEDFEVTTKTKISEKTFLNLSYKRSFSLNQDKSKVGVEYKLNRHFSVVGNIDEEGNLNFKYRYRYAY